MSWDSEERLHHGKGQCPSVFRVQKPEVFLALVPTAWAECAEPRSARKVGLSRTPDRRRSPVQEQLDLTMDLSIPETRRSHLRPEVHELLRRDLLAQVGKTVEASGLLRH